MSRTSWSTGEPGVFIRRIALRRGPLAYRSPRQAAVSAQTPAADMDWTQQTRTYSGESQAFGTVGRLERHGPVRPCELRRRRVSIYWLVTWASARHRLRHGEPHHRPPPPGNGMIGCGRPQRTTCGPPPSGLVTNAFCQYVALSAGDTPTGVSHAATIRGGQQCKPWQPPGERRTEVLHDRAYFGCSQRLARPQRAARERRALSAESTPAGCVGHSPRMFRARLEDPASSTWGSGGPW